MRGIHCISKIRRSFETDRVENDYDIYPDKENGVFISRKLELLLTWGMMHCTLLLPKLLTKKMKRGADSYKYSL